MLFTKFKDSSFNAPIGSDVGEEDIDEKLANDIRSMPTIFIKSLL